MDITIPTDNDGYVLLQCERCGEYFKITPSDIEDESILWLFCPMCGMTSESYVTEDVMELAVKMVKNYAIDTIYSALKPLEKTSKKSPIKIKIGKKPKKEYESPISAGIDSLVIQEYKCCSKTAKIHPLLKVAGSCCPFCGVDYGTK